MSLTITAYNVRSLGSGKVYINELLEQNDSDVLFLSEHRLYDNELHKLNIINDKYDINAKASSDLDARNQSHKAGHCGIAMFWKKELNQIVKLVRCESDRICAIEIIGACFTKSLFVIGVYLPHQNCKITSMQKHVNILSDLISKCKCEGEVIIIGDTNCHFGDEYGDRCWGKTTANGKMLMQMITRHDMKVLDICSDYCSGPTYTFNVEGVGKSYIDHCIISSLVECNVVKCEVIDDSCNNMSDHLPIIVKINATLNQGEETTIGKAETIAWHKVTQTEIKKMYTACVDEKLKIHLNKTNDEESRIDKLESSNNAGRLIEDFVNEIVSCMIDAAKKLPSSKFKKHQKPYWNESLNIVARENKQAWRIWVNANRPRDDHPLFIRHKECKRNFRVAQKQAELQYELDNMREITCSQDVDQKYFWHMVNKHKKKQNSASPIKISSGEVLTNCNAIRDAWKDYFQKLYTPDVTNQYDEEFRKVVEERLPEMVKESYESNENLLSHVSQKEIDIIIKNLKCKKSPGHDRITNEHLKYGGDVLCQCIVKLFQLIAKYEYIPQNFKKGVIIPIPKGDKNRTIQDNYRGITLIPALAKLFEKWIMLKVENWAKEINLIHNMQGASQPHCSSLQTAWLLRESIAFNREKGNTVYIGLLDTKKAFDTVWQDGLFFKLHEYGLNGKTWRILKELFNNFTCCVRIGAEISESFIALQGIHQGAPCSMFLYQIVGNELLCMLNECIASAKCGNINVGAICYADDIALIGTSKDGIQRLCSIAYNYSKKWRFKFNPSKCSIIVFGKDQQSNRNVMLGKECIKIVKKDVHLGIVLSNKEEYICEDIEKRMLGCKNICYITKGLGSKKVPITPITSTKLYSSVCLPKLCYGMEIMNLNEKCIESVESFHSNMAKDQQGLPQRCSNLGCLRTIGWKSLSAHIDIMKIIFLWQLLLLPIKCIYKKVCLYRFCSRLYSNETNMGPIENIMNTCVKYGLLQMVIESVESGIYMSIIKWKVIVKDAIYTYDKKKIMIQCKCYKSLSMLSLEGESRQISPWWEHAYADPSFGYMNIIIVRLLLNVNLYCEKICPCCTAMVTNNVHHILFECQCNKDVREVLWNNVAVHCPKALFTEINNMSNSTRTTFILNAFYVKFEREWKLVYDALSLFIYNTNQKYVSILESM